MAGRRRRGSAGRGGHLAVSPHVSPLYLPCISAISPAARLGWEEERGRCSGDMGEIWARYRRDIGEVGRSSGSPLGIGIGLANPNPTLTRTLTLTLTRTRTRTRALTLTLTRTRTQTLTLTLTLTISLSLTQERLAAPADHRRRYLLNPLIKGASYPTPTPIPTPTPKPFQVRAALRAPAQLHGGPAPARTRSGAAPCARRAHRRGRPEGGGVKLSDVLCPQSVLSGV